VNQAVFASSAGALARFQEGADSAPAPSATTPTADDRATSFRAVEGGGNMQSGEKLLVEAYAAIWLILFVMIWFSWRRQKKIDARVDDLEAAVARAYAETKSPGGSSERGAD